MGGQTIFSYLLLSLTTALTLPDPSSPLRLGTLATLDRIMSVTVIKSVNIGLSSSGFNEKMGCAVGTIPEVEIIKVGPHEDHLEAEFRDGGEACLQNLTRCKKNPDHREFLPIQNFNIEHLPSEHRNQEVFRWIKAEADLTCRLLVGCISENRPKFYPGRQGLLYPFFKKRGTNCISVGTGWVAGVEKYTQEDCECSECVTPGTHTPHRVWGKVTLLTARHVVFDDVEANVTKCYFGYDTSATYLTRCNKLIGLKVENKNTEGDICVMSYATHNMEIVEWLERLCGRRDDLWEEVMQKYEPETNTGLSVPAVRRTRRFTPCPVVVISHPHGFSKHLSIGMMKNRKAFRKLEYQHGDGSVANMVNARYTYDAATCPGSSGAPVFKLPEREGWWARSGVFHSGGGKKNNNSNRSGVWMEMDSLIPDRAGPDSHLN